MENGLAGPKPALTRMVTSLHPYILNTVALEAVSPEGMSLKLIIGGVPALSISTLGARLKLVS